MNFLEKLDFLMNKYGLNKRTLSQKCGIPYTTIDAWYKKGYEGLKLTTLRKLNDFFNTSLDYWILDKITDPNYGRASGFEVEYDEMEHIKKYRALDGHGKESVNITLQREFIRMEQLAEKDRTIAEISEVNIEVDNQPAMRLINYYYRLASAGTGQILFDMPPTKRIEIPDLPEYRKADYAIGVNGNSMEPTYSDGDMLLVEMAEEITIGEIGIFTVNNECFVKKLGNQELISLNPEYPNILLNETTKCMGRVIGKLSLTCI